jgi:hypothetical protein
VELARQPLPLLQGRLVAHLFVQARVLNGDRRLLGEEHRQLRVTVAEPGRTALVVNRDGPDHLLTRAHRHTQNRARRVTRQDSGPVAARIVLRIVASLRLVGAHSFTGERAIRRDAQTLSSVRA